MDGRYARAVLGVPAHADSEELRHAFRRRVLDTHPDHGGDRTAFELVVLAFETLQHVTNPPQVSTSPSFEPARTIRTRFAAYDSPRSALPPRAFADVLRVAVARAA
jgi:hypothetical protein